MSETVSDSVDMVGLEIGTSAPCNLVALARSRRFAAEIRLVVFRPEEGIFEQVVDSIGMVGRLGGVRELVVRVVWRKGHRKWDKLWSKRIEGRTRTVTGNTRGNRRFRFVWTNR